MQDLASGQSQVLSKTTGGTATDFLYGQERLLALSGGVRGWYLTDGQGSVRQQLDDNGAVTYLQNYDPYGQPETTAHSPRDRQPSQSVDDAGW